MRSRNQHPHRFFTAADDESLIELYRAGASLVVIGRQIGRHPASVRHRVHRLINCGRLKPRPKNSPPPPKCADLSHISAEDLAWMSYWSQPRPVRRAQQRERIG